MNRLFMFCAGLFLMGSMSGCCLLHGGGACGAPRPFGGAGAFSGGGCGPCQGGCGVAPGGFPSAAAPFGGQTAFAPQYGAQTAFANPYGAPAIAMDPMPTIIR